MNNFRLNKVVYLILLIIPRIILKRSYRYFSYFKFIADTKRTQTPITFDLWYDQIILKKNYGPYWPVHSTSTVSGWKNIYCGIETCPGYSPGNYISAYYGKIFIGDYTQIAPNVGIIAANHDVYDNSEHIPSEVRIGQYCWIGMGAVILPGVVLGDFSIVGAGAIVTKSFPEGHCIIAGNPAIKIKILDKDKCIRKRSEYEYNGYLTSSKFEDFRQKYLNV